jgi:hypothetical protein
MVVSTRWHITFSPRQQKKRELEIPSSSRVITQVDSGGASHKRKVARDCIAKNLFAIELVNGLLGFLEGIVLDQSVTL